MWVQVPLQIVGGRPAAGKTEYALKTAEALAINKNIPVLYFTLGDSIDTAKNHMKAICEDDEFLDGAQVFFEDKYFTVKDIEQQEVKTTTGSAVKKVKRRKVL